MSIIAAAVKHMMDAGMPSEAIIAAIAAMEAEMPAQASRSKAAIRQANYRERKASQTITNHNETSQSVTSDVPPALSPPNENNLTPPIPTPVYIPRGREAFPKLDCAEPQTWADFLKNRKAKRLPCTATAHKRLVSDLAAMVGRTGWPPGKIFEQCVGKGWGAIYDPRDEQDKQNGNGKRTGSNPKGNGTVDSFTAALRHIQARSPDSQGFNDPDRMRRIASVSFVPAE